MKELFSGQDRKITSLADVRRLEQVPVAELGLPESSYELIATAAERYGDRVALRFLPLATTDEQSISFSYGELFARVTQAANAFHSLGVTPSRAVSMMLPNLPQTHFTIWGAEAAGIFNPVNPLLEVEHIASILREAGTRVLVTLGPNSDPDLWSKAVALREQVPELAYILTVELPGVQQSSGQLCEEVLDFDSLLDRQPSEALLSGRCIKSTDVASYFHTGGTTGTPKLAPHTHLNEMVSTYQLVVAINADENSKGLCGLPLFHVNAVFVTGLAPWMVGGEVIIATPGGYRTPSLMSNFWHLVEKYRITYFSAVPTILSALLDVPSEEYDLSSLDAALCGAAPLATELMRKFEAKTGLVIIEGYGQTEGTTATSVNPRYGDRRVGSVGLPLPYCKVRIVDVDDAGSALRDCDVDESGVIAINGPNVFAGYKQPAQNEGQWVEPGWFNTGDLGRLDADGYLWLTGRSKDLIIRGGHNIDPQMIEETYYYHAKVQEAVAIGRPDKRVGELPMVVIQLKPGETASEREMLDYGAAHIQERAAVPKEVRFVQAMPLTAVGKVFKPTLRNEVVKDLVVEELRNLSVDPRSVSVQIDKRYGQCVTVTTDAVHHDEVRAILGDYAFRLELTN